MAKNVVMFLGDGMGPIDRDSSEDSQGANAGLGRGGDNPYMGELFKLRTFEGTRTLPLRSDCGSCQPWGLQS